MTLAATLGALALACILLLQRRITLSLLCFGCVLLLLRPSVVYGAGAEACMPVRYADGDTFNFVRGGAVVRVRIAGFDAPERGQAFGQAAEDRLRLLTRGGATCDCYKTDRHGRSVCTVRTRTGDNVAAVMLAAGLGGIDPRFEGEASAEDREAARAALTQAQAQRLGMWSRQDAQCAVDFRRAQRAQ